MSFFIVKFLNIDLLEFRNVGRMPADNLRITINTLLYADNLTLGLHTQNTTLNHEEGRWIIETRKFPIGGRIAVTPNLKNLSEPATYFIIVSSDQGVKEGTLFVNPVNNTIRTSLFIPPPIPVNIAPAIIGLVAASVMALVYVLAKNRENSRIRRRLYYLKEINDEVYRYYTGREENKNSHLKTLDTLRNDIRNEFVSKKIKRSDFEALENKILERRKNK